MEAKTKRCSKCGEEKEFSEFNKAAKYTDGHQCQCRSCSKAFYQEHRLEHLAKCKEYYAANAEEIKLNARLYAEVNVEHIRVAKKLYRKRNCESIALYQKDYRPSYAANNREKLNNKTRHRRALRFAALGKHNNSQVQAIFNSQTAKCVYCSCNLAEASHIDHIIPLVLNGSNWPSNLQILCPNCNWHKAAKHPDQYEKEIGFDREEYEKKYPRPNFGECNA